MENIMFLHNFYFHDFMEASHKNFFKIMWSQYNENTKVQISERNPNHNFISITVNFRIGHRHAVRLYRGWVGGLTCNLLYNPNSEGGWFDFVNGFLMSENNYRGGLDVQVVSGRIGKRQIFDEDLI